MTPTAKERRRVCSRPKKSIGFQNEESLEEIYGIKDKLNNEKFEVSLAIDMDGRDLTLQYLQEYGFTKPLRFLDKVGLGIVIPNPKGFSVKKVCKLVGEDRTIHVQCCMTQTSIRMPMSKFVKYYFSKDRTEIFNVLSLEFSDTDMDKLVQRPVVVDHMDWIDLAFPAHLKQFSNQGTNQFYYPKVQKYCLMSVAGSYTTFHIDFGGTSVWYHVLKGKKIFWLIEPTAKNLNLFEEWNSSEQDSVFLGDLVDQCQRVELEAGTTFMIPSGWIHAVYTPVDSLVFGGNFLHSYSIPMQQRIVEMEERTDVPREQRFPLLNELHWFVLEGYVHRMEGKYFLGWERDDDDDLLLVDLHLTKFEVEGLTVLVNTLAESKDFDYVKGIEDLHGLHAAGVEMLAKYGSGGCKRPAFSSPLSLSRAAVPMIVAKSAPKKKSPKNTSKTLGCKKTKRIRMVPCKTCDGCRSEDCKLCKNCLDKPKYGGKGIMKKACVVRRCRNLQLPTRLRKSTMEEDGSTMADAGTTEDVTHEVETEDVTHEVETELPPLVPCPSFRNADVPLYLDDLMSTSDEEDAGRESDVNDMCVDPPSTFEHDPIAGWTAFNVDFELGSDDDDDCEVLPPVSLRHYAAAAVLF